MHFLFYIPQKETLLSGEMAEWLKAAVLKTAELFSGFRGFESHSLRHIMRLKNQQRQPQESILRLFLCLLIVVKV